MDFYLKEKFKKAYQEITKKNNILVIAHKHPDGDALSSVSAISILLDQLHKKYTLFCIDTVPYSFSYLPNIEKMTTNSNINLQNFDLIIVLDCGNSDRTGIAKKLKNKNNPHQLIIEFDHHPKIENYSDIEIRMEGKSSTAEILFHFFKINNLKITKNIATCILTGILTDTANFLYPSANYETINISSDMISCGASISKITKKTWQNKSLIAMKTLGIVLENLTINKKYNIAFSILTYEEIKKLKKETRKDDDIFDLINGFLSNIKNVKAVVFLREEKKGEIKGSLRTNHPNIEITGLARLLGGGGHPKACGFNINGSIIKTKNSWKII